MEGEGSYICLHTLIFEFSAHTIEDYTVESRPRSGISTCINRSSICQLAWHFLSCVTCQSYQQWFCMWWMSYLWFFSPENVVMLWCIKTKAKITQQFDPGMWVYIYRKYRSCTCVIVTYSSTNWLHRGRNEEHDLCDCPWWYAFFFSFFQEAESRVRSSDWLHVWAGVSGERA